MTDRSVVVSLRAQIHDFQAKFAAAGASSEALTRKLEGNDSGLKKVESSAANTGKEIDKLSGRIGLLLSGVGAVGPAAVPISALAVPAVMGLANSFGMAAVAGGSLLVASQGVSNAVKALEKARLAPTAANLEAAHLAMEKLGPDAQKFARSFQDFLPVLREVRDASAAGWFPGLEHSLTNLERLAPKVADIFHRVGEAGGELAADGTASLAGKRWDDFFTFIGDEAPQVLTELGHTVGDLTHGLAELWMAFDPSNDKFSAWMMDAAHSFDEWASGLSKTDGFHEFLDYLDANGPKVADALGSISNAVLQIVEAAAPLGGPTLQILTKLVDAIATIADSSLGTPLLALFQITSAMKLMGKAAETSFGQILLGQQQVTLGYEKAGASVKLFAADVKAASSYGYMGRVTDQQTAAVGRLSEKVKSFGKSAALIGGLTVVTSGLGDSMGLANTASMALMGTMVAPGWGTGIGAVVGGFMDMKAAFDASSEAADRARQAILEGSRAALLDARAQILQRLADPGWLENTGALHNALGEVNDALHRGPGPADLMAAAVGRTGAQMRQAAKDTQAFNVQLEILQGFFDKRAAMRAYAQSVDDLTKALRKNSKNWDIDTKAGRDHLALLDANATAMMQAADKINNAKARRSFLQDARDQLVAFKKQFPGAAHAIDVLLHKLDAKLDGFSKPRKPNTPEVDDKPANHHIDQLRRRLDDLGSQRPTPKIDADNKPARTKINSTDQLLASLTGHPYTATVRADTGAAQAKVTAFQRQVDSLRDGYVTVHVSRVGGDLPYASGGQHHATGGPIVGPGGPRDDMVPIMGSNGEYMIKAAAVDHYGIGFFDRANAMRLADGGPVGSSTGKNTYLSVQTHGVQHELDGLAHKLKLAQAAVDKERAQRDKLLQSEQQLASGIRDTFTQSPWNRDQGSPWMAQVAGGGWKGALLGDIADIRQYNRSLHELRSKGVHGKAFAAIAADDPMVAEQMADESRKQLAQYARLYKVRSQLAAKAGQYAGDVVYGHKIDVTNQHLAHLQAEVHHLRTEQHHANQHLSHLRKEQAQHAKAAGKAAGEATGQAINAGGNHGRRKARSW